MDDFFQVGQRSSERFIEDLATAIEGRLGPRDDSTAAFMARAEQALADAREHGTLRARLRCHLGLAQYAYMRSDRGEVLKHSQAAVALARQLSDSQLLRRALSIRASMLGDQWALGGALTTFADAIDAANATGDAEQQAVVWHNLANTMMALGAYQDAHDMTRLTLQLLGRFDASESTQRSYWNAQTLMATALFHLQEPSKSLRVLRQGLERMPTLHDANDFLAATELHQQYVYVMLAVENLARAEEHAALAKKMAGRCGYPRALIAADLAQGLVDVHKGHIRDGMAQLEDCLDRSYKVSMGTIRDSLWALVTAHEVIGDRQMVATYLGRLVDSLMSAARDIVRTQVSHLGGSDDVGALQLCLSELATSAGLRDDPTGAHGPRVGYVAAMIGGAMGLSDEECRQLQRAGDWHDVGKIAIPQQILLKRDPLSDDERAVVRRHAELGEQLLMSFEMPGMNEIAAVARSHHERWDGSGYPDGLKGDAIPRDARIVSVAEVFDTLVYSRPYKAAWPVADAIAEIRQLAGTYFDPAVVEHFCAVASRLQQEHGDLLALTNLASEDSEFVSGRRRVMQALRAAARQ